MQPSVTCCAAATHHLLTSKSGFALYLYARPVLEQSMDRSNQQPECPRCRGSLLASKVAIDIASLCRIASGFVRDLDDFVNSGSLFSLSLFLSPLFASLFSFCLAVTLRGNC